jgi:hypothetical protein
MEATIKELLSGPIPAPDDSEFAPIRAEFCRLYLQHRDVLGMAGQPDSAIVDQVDDITAALLGLTMRALMNQDRAWLVKHAWFGTAAQQLLHGQAATVLDG